MSRIYFEILSICKGGGYMYARTKPLHPKANSKGLYPLHRVLVENKLGRILEDGEDVHHIDENKNNNDISNLLVLTRAEHAKLHSISRKAETISCVCSYCKKDFTTKLRDYRHRMSKNKTKKIFCSRLCGWKDKIIIKNER